MNENLFIILLNPAVALLMSFALFYLWRQRPEKTYALLASLGLGTLSIAFLIQNSNIVKTFELSRIVSNSLFLTTVLLICCATLLRMGVRIPRWSFIAVSFTGSACFAYYLFIDPDTTSRIHVVNLTFGTLFLITISIIFRKKLRHKVDMAIAVLSTLATLNFLTKPILIFVFYDNFEKETLFTQTTYWNISQLSGSLLSISVALSFMVAVVSDLMSDLAAESNTDKLSGLLNRRGFEAEVRSWLEKSKRKNDYASLILADLDHFKDINDTYGHEAGDKVIELFSKNLQEVFGTDAVIGRVGGEEFAIFVTGTNLYDTQVLADRARITFSEMPVAFAPEDRFTASFGIAALSGEDELSDIFRSADHALYTAKGSGRNRTCIRLCANSTDQSQKVTAAEMQQMAEAEMRAHRSQR